MPLLQCLDRIDQDACLVHQGVEHCLEVICRRRNEHYDSLLRAYIDTRTATVTAGQVDFCASTHQADSPPRTTLRAQAAADTALFFDLYDVKCQGGPFGRGGATR